MDEEIEQAAQVEEVAEAVEQPTPQDDDVQDWKSKALAAEQESQILRDHVELLKSNRQNVATDVQQPSSDDYVTHGEVAELKAMAKYKDYESVITNFLPEAIKENPQIATWIRSLPASQAYEQAYFLSKKSDAFIKQSALKNRSPEAQKLATNISKTGSLSSVGKAPSTSSTPDWMNMSDAEFMAHHKRYSGDL